LLIVNRMTRDVVGWFSHAVHLGDLPALGLFIRAGMAAFRFPRSD